MITDITPKFVEYMPDELENGILYISNEFNVAIHKCACGCGIDTITPFNYADGSQWTLTNNNGLVSLNPSIGNQQFPCKSHYFIKNNKIEWL